MLCFTQPTRSSEVMDSYIKNDEDNSSYYNNNNNNKDDDVSQDFLNDAKDGIYGTQDNIFGKFSFIHSF